VHAVPAYTVVSDQELGDRNHVAEVLTSRGFDGVVAMRMVSATQTLHVDPGRDPGYEDPWTNRWGTVESIAEVRIEVNAYSLPSKKLVWSAMSKATNPDGTREAIRDVSEVTGNKLAEERVVAAPQAAAR